MRLEAFAAFDKVVGAFMSPFFVRNKGEAIRSFADACNDSSHPFSKHSTDFDLMHIGAWDDNSGMFEPMSPERVVSSFEVVNRDKL